MKKHNIIQRKNRKTGQYVKIDRGRKRIISSRKTPFKGVPKR